MVARRSGKRWPRRHGDPCPLRTLAAWTPAPEAAPGPVIGPVTMTLKWSLTDCGVTRAPLSPDVRRCPVGYAKIDARVTPTSLRRDEDK